MPNGGDERLSSVLTSGGHGPDIIILPEFSLKESNTCTELFVLLFMYVKEFLQLALLGILVWIQICAYPMIVIACGDDVESM